MSLHSSLKRAERMSSTRSIMKRVERIKWLIGKGRWTEEDRVLGLPKIKVVKLKAVKKEKVKEEAPAGAPAVAGGEQSSKPAEVKKAEGKKSESKK